MMKKPFLFFVCLIALLPLWGQTGHFYSSDQFSSSLISSLCQDRQGYIWVGTDYGLNKFDGYYFTPYLHDEADTTSLSVNVIVCLYCDRDGQLWVGTNHGIDRYDAARDCFVHYQFPDGRHPRICSIVQQADGTMFFGTAGYGAYTLGADGRLHHFSLENTTSYYSRCYEDSNGRMWMNGFDEKLCSWKDGIVEHYNSEFGMVQDYQEWEDGLLILGLHGLMIYRDGKLSSLNVDMGALSGSDVVFSRMAVNDDGDVYVGTRGRGVYKLTGSRNYRLEPVQLDAYGINAQTALISVLFFDRLGNLWLGCQHKGLLMKPQHPMPFRNWSFRSQGLQLGSAISSVCEGDNGMVWCTVQGVGVYGFNRNGRVVAHPSAPEAVEFIFRDRQRNYWVGTDDGFFGYDPSTGRYRQEVTFDCDRFNDMTSDDRGRIYISTFSRGFCVYDPKTGELKNHHVDERDSVRGKLCNNWVMGMMVDHQGLLWLATSSGFACYDADKDDFVTQGWQSQLSGIVCFDVCELTIGRLADGRDLRGCVAVGTEEGLFLYDRKKHTTERFPGSEQLRNKVISYIVQSANGDLWCSTSQGIWQFEHDSKTFIGHVNGNGLTAKEYLYGVGMHGADDRVYFGHNDGITSFLPAEVKDRRPRLDSLQLSAFLVGNQTVSMRTVLNDVRVTDRAVSESSYFTLNYLDHTVTLAFSQFNFDNPSNSTLEHRINGGEWLRNAEGINHFTLSHLQPGTYRIEVRAQCAGAYTPVKVVVIIIKAPWYRSMTAYLIYFLLLLALAYYIYYNYRRRAAEQLSEEKMKFLINATHDIRSPLTLIMGPLEKMKRMLQDTEASADVASSLDTIERNAQRIQNLVNQILDVRKIDKQQMHLHCEETDLIDFSRSICKMFEYNAHERNINFTFNHGELDELRVWVDRSQFDKVITNLISNAFKYTFDGGSIELRVSASEQQARLEVCDTGLGLDPNSIKHIFERFYQGNNSRRMHTAGTGIGLNLCKMIVDLHHGSIEAGNRSDGQQGSVFTVILPLGNSHLSSEEIEQTPTVTATGENGAPAPGAASAEAPVMTGSGRHRVLIVDDDEEIGRYIANELSHFYKFGFCSNGKEGLRELLSHDYDVVVSDVMMPEMDGFTMLRMIKTNMNISHIPVIMLTSKSDVGNRLEGLERGADAFLAKPFNMDELHGVIDNLIQGRLRLKGKYSGAQQQADKVERPEVKGNDEQLMERIMKAVNKNLGDSDFSVEMLTQEVGISRAQLHRKMKEMTGLSTSEFIRNIRLEQAARLLKEQKINVTQVAYTVGFSNLAHFSTIFRKHFGVSPSEYAETASSE